MIPKFHVWLSWNIYLLLLCASALNWLLSSVLMPSAEWWWWWFLTSKLICCHEAQVGVESSTWLTGPSHTPPHPSLPLPGRQDQFILSPFQSAVHQMALGLASYLALHPFQPFCLCSGWEMVAGEAMRQGTHRIIGLVVEWELVGSFTRRSLTVSLGTCFGKGKKCFFPSCWGISVAQEWMFKDWREGYKDCGNGRCLASRVT